MSPKVPDFKIIKGYTHNSRSQKKKKKKKFPKSGHEEFLGPNITKKNHQDREPLNYVDLWTPC
jgi:hypothetical protein